ncbi:GNAT family N-acetyltransferase [Actinoallomurus purpureus]|uniref:GNAT family N-acetyltransferase n=1 Tax=Actinoallomurus purpureus TaxID=478114 RepID=UPI00209239FB|nr:GNAT family N-acetyltransferase [Actinoallomurus purpureus]MCO6010215.1 GNAT family N-acetyltransferase [Actinoallomurus purpureus]
MIVRTYDGCGAAALTEKVVGLYAAVFAEPPYAEGPEDVEDFRDLLAIEIPQPGFRLVTAEVDGELVGFAYAYSLREATRWWEDITPSPAPEVTAERDGRTFAVKELAVAAPYRRKGIGRRLHGVLLARRSEERATLTVRPDAAPALAAYESWNWSQLGVIRPGGGEITYVVMVRSLP